jgi:hypothetical protein
VIVTHISARIGAIYAGPRRYALFTLVQSRTTSIHAPTATAASGPNEPMPASDRRLNGGLNQSSSRRQRARDRNTGKRGITAIVHPSPVVLDAGASGALRDRIAAELKGIGSSGDAATWANRVLAAKDALVTADAEQIEAAFRQKLGILPCPTRPTNTIKFMLVKPARRADTPQIDKSELSYPHSRSRAPTVRHQTAMSGLWSHTPRSAPSALCAASGAGSPVNSQCRSAAVIIARSFAAAMRRHGSRRSAWIRPPQPMSSGSKRSLPARPRAIVSLQTSVHFVMSLPQHPRISYANKPIRIRGILHRAGAQA